MNRKLLLRKLSSGALHNVALRDFVDLVGAFGFVVRMTSKAPSLFNDLVAKLLAGPSGSLATAANRSLRPAPGSPRRCDSPERAAAPTPVVTPPRNG